MLVLEFYEDEFATVFETLGYSGDEGYRKDYKEINTSIVSASFMW